MSEPLPPPQNDKENLWGWWYTAKKWQNQLHKTASYKALDIPEEMGDINAPKTMISHNGVSPVGLAALAAVGLGGWYFLTKDKPAAPPTPPPVIQVPAQPAPVQPTPAPLEDRDYVVTFTELQPDGTYKPITVDRKPQ